MTVRAVLRESLVAFVAALVAAIASTWPLATRLSTGARDRVDVLYEAWLIDWIGHAATSSARIFDPNLFHPAPAAATGADPLLGVALPLVSLRFMGFGPLAVHNIGLLLAIAFTAAAGYACGRVMTGARSAGVVVAAALAFGPVFTTEGGHIQIIACAGLPLAVLGAWLVVDSARAVRPSTGAVALLSASLAWQITVSFYVAFYAAIAGALVLVAQARHLRRADLVRLAIGGAAFALIAVPLVAQYRRRPEPVPSLGEALARVGPLSGDFVHTHPKLLVWGGLLGRGSGWFALTGGAFPGLAIVVGAVLGAGYAWRSRDAVVRRVGGVAAVLVGAGAVLALGAAPSGPRRFTPWRFAMQFVPPLRGLRAANRGIVVALVGLALLAALGVSWIASRLRLPPTAMAVGLAFLIVLEGLGSWGGTPQVETRAVDTYLAHDPSAGAVLYLPVPVGDVASVFEWSQAEVAFRSTAHHRATVNGYGSYVPDSYFAMKRAVASLPDDASLAALRDLGVRFVVVDRAAAVGTPWAHLADPTVAAEGGRAGLRLARVFDLDVLYEVQ